MANLKNIKKGDKVIMRLFTGAFSGVKEVEKADKDFIYFTTGKGMSKFSRKTGKMVEPAPKTEAYANYIEEYDADVEAEEAAKLAKKSKKPEPEEIEDEDEEEEEEEEYEAPAPKKKVAKKAVKKVSKKSVEEDEDDEDFEEVE